MYKKQPVGWELRKDLPEGVVLAEGMIDVEELILEPTAISGRSRLGQGTSVLPEFGTSKSSNLETADDWTVNFGRDDDDEAEGDDVEDDDDADDDYEDDDYDDYDDDDDEEDFDDDEEP